MPPFLNITASFSLKTAKLRNKPSQAMAYGRRELGI
jgi:hypothetical protein